MSRDFTTPLPDGSAVHSRICRQSNAVDAARFEQIRYFRTITKGQKIASAGYDMDFLAIVQTGAVVSTREGRISGLLVAGDFIGMAGRPSCHHDLFALDDCVLKCFRRGPFESLLEQSPSIAGRLQDCATDEIAAEREWLRLPPASAPRARVVGFLEALFGRLQRAGHVENPTIAPPEVVSDVLAIGGETFARILAELETEGAIQRGPDGITLRDAALLRA